MQNLDMSSKKTLVTLTYVFDVTTNFYTFLEALTDARLKICRRGSTSVYLNAPFEQTELFRSLIISGVVIRLYK